MELGESESEFDSLSSEELDEELSPSPQLSDSPMSLTSPIACVVAAVGHSHLVVEVEVGVWSVGIRELDVSIFIYFVKI